MRTKLVLGAALLAAGLASSMAQNVYSLNVVGYVNQTVAAGQWYMWGNPLSAGGENSTATVMTNLSGTHAAWDTATVYQFSNAGGYYNADSFIYSPADSLDGWYAGGNGEATGGYASLPPGRGFFFYAPTAGTVTFVGEVQTTNVMQISNANGGWNMVASAFPVSTNLVALGMQGVDGDNVWRYDNGYNWTVSYIVSPPDSLNGWYDGFGSPIQGPNLNVGEAVFYQRNPAASSATWTQVFTIQ